jgi:hypothetical protein
MRKIIMIEKEKIFKTSLLKCIKLQDSNAFSIKLNIFSFRLKIGFFHLDIA